MQQDNIPLFEIEGTAYECGQWYAELVVSRYPGYDEYLSEAVVFCKSAEVRKIFEKRAPYIVDVYNGMLAVIGTDQKGSQRQEEMTGQMLDKTAPSSDFQRTVANKKNAVPIAKPRF